MKILSDVKLKIALDKNGNIVDIRNAKRSDEYHCYCCGNRVYPKALESSYVKMHFCHYNSECKKEGIEHLMMKYFILDKDVLFIDGTPIHINKQMTLLEKRYRTKFGYYIPDAVLFTQDGKRVFLEIKNSNAKTDQYILKFNELKSDVIEYDIKTNNIYYIYKSNTGFCGSNKNIKIEKQIDFINYQNDNSLSLIRIERLNNFWIECRKYEITKIDNDVIDAFAQITDYKDKEYAFYILRDLNCTKYISDVLEDFSHDIIRNSKLPYLQDEVKLFLRLNKMTQKEFAERMECIPPSRLSRWLQGHYRFGYVYLNRVKKIIYGGT